MKWSYRIARVAGIDIKLHVSFYLMVLLFGILWGFPYGIGGVVFWTVMMLLLFVCVLLHELGHSIVAQRFGIPVREILLLPLGGVALLERNPSKPLHELLIAIAGPLVNLIIVVMIEVGLLIAANTIGNLVIVDEEARMMASTAPSLITMIEWLLVANFSLFLFNLIPAFPLDGGRILRAVLAMVIGAPRATRITTTVGQMIAVILGVFGLFFNPILILIAIFIFFGAGQERVEGQARTVLSTLRVGDAYNRHVLTLQIGDRVSKVIDYILTSYQPDFAVVQGNRLLGVITRDDVLRVLANPPRDIEVPVPDIYVTLIMQREVMQVEASQSLDEVRQLMSERGVRFVAVYEQGMYLGLVNMDDIAEAFAVLAFAERYEQNRQQQRVD